MIERALHDAMAMRRDDGFYPRFIAFTRHPHAKYSNNVPRHKNPFALNALRKHLVNLVQKAPTLVFWTMSMETPAPMSLMSCLSLVDDPRRAGYARRHDLQEIPAMAVCAVLCNMNTFEEIAFWAESKEA